jgi:predicted DNA-binding antitoxin AbrB/MazE fold protein
VEQKAEAIYENGVLRPLTALLDLTEGQRVLVTVEPVAQLDPAEYARRRAELLRRLEADGAIAHFPCPPVPPSPADFQPIVIEGEPLSETIIKNRR